MITNRETPLETYFLKFSTPTPTMIIQYEEMYSAECQAEIPLEHFFNAFQTTTPLTMTMFYEEKCTIS